MARNHSKDDVTVNLMDGKTAQETLRQILKIMHRLGCIGRIAIQNPEDPDAPIYSVVLGAWEEDDIVLVAAELEAVRRGYTDLPVWLQRAA